MELGDWRLLNTQGDAETPAKQGIVSAGHFARGSEQTGRTGPHGRPDESNAFS